MLRNRLAIDLSRLNDVTIDRNKSAMTIGGGAKIRDVLTPVSQAGYQIRTSSADLLATNGLCINSFHSFCGL